MIIYKTFKTLKTLKKLNLLNYFISKNMMNINKTQVLNILNYALSVSAALSLSEVLKNALSYFITTIIVFKSINLNKIEKADKIAKITRIDKLNIISATKNKIKKKTRTFFEMLIYILKKYFNYGSNFIKYLLSLFGKAFLKFLYFKAGLIKMIDHFFHKTTLGIVIRRILLCLIILAILYILYNFFFTPAVQDLENEHPYFPEGFWGTGIEKPRFSIKKGRYPFYNANQVEAIKRLIEIQHAYGIPLNEIDIPWRNPDFDPEQNLKDVNEYILNLSKKYAEEIRVNPDFKDAVDEFMNVIKITPSGERIKLNLTFN